MVQYIRIEEERGLAESGVRTEKGRITVNSIAAKNPWPLVFAMILEIHSPNRHHPFTINLRRWSRMTRREKRTRRSLQSTETASAHVTDAFAGSLIQHNHWAPAGINQHGVNVTFKFMFT